jgi:hypothetical protein
MLFNHYKKMILIKRARLNLADQQLGASNTTNIPSLSKRTTTVNETAANKLLKYENSTYGIKMQYPSDWRVEGFGNSSVGAVFFPKGNNASNVSVDVSINNLTTSFTPDEYLNSLMRGDAAASKDFPGIQFSIHTTSNVVLASHPGFLLVGTFRDPTSGVLDGFSNIGTIIGDKVYSIQYYSPEQTYPVYSTTYSKMIKSFEVTLLTYENSTYGIRVQYPPDWTVSGTNESRADQVL